jgi:3-oxoacyl-[acyl-carrier-protein] synthase-3
MIEPGQALSDLAILASERALEMAKLPPKKLDLIVLGTSTADMLSPSTACIVEEALHYPPWLRFILYPSLFQNS